MFRSRCVKLSLPFFGQFCCCLAGLPYCCEEEGMQGPLVLDGAMAAKGNKGVKFLGFQEGKDEGDTFRGGEVGEGAAAMTVWAGLMDWHLSLWSDREAKVAGAQPMLRIPVNRDTRIEDRGDDLFIFLSLLLLLLLLLLFNQLILILPL